MRLIILFLLLSLEGQAQIIRAQPFYVPQSLVVTNLLLDSFPNAAVAYSLRKLSKNYTGSAIRVRKSSNNAEQDIGFTSNNDLDTSALKTFIGATDTGYITKWYDQVGSRNGSQSTAANQPRIIANNTITRAGNMPSIYFNGSSKSLRCDSVYNTGAIYFFWVDQPLTTSGRMYVYAEGGPNNNSGNIAILHNATASRNTLTWTNTALSSSTSNFSTSSVQLFTAYKTGSTSNWSYGYFKNGSADGGPFTTTINSAAERQAAIGAQGTYNAQYLNAYLSEIIYYTSDQSSNRTGIENNINNFYKIW